MTFSEYLRAREYPIIVRAHDGRTQTDTACLHPRFVIYHSEDDDPALVTVAVSCPHGSSRIWPGYDTSDDELVEMAIGAHCGIGERHGCDCLTKKFVDARLAYLEECIA